MPGGTALSVTFTEMLAKLEVRQAMVKYMSTVIVMLACL